MLCEVLVCDCRRVSAHLRIGHVHYCVITTAVCAVETYCSNLVVEARPLHYYHPPTDVEHAKSNRSFRTAFGLPLTHRVVQKQSGSCLRVRSASLESLAWSTEFDLILIEAHLPTHSDINPYPWWLFAEEIFAHDANEEMHALVSLKSFPTLWSSSVQTEWF